MIQKLCRACAVPPFLRLVLWSAPCRSPWQTGPCSATSLFTQASPVAFPWVYGTCTAGLAIPFPCVLHLPVPAWTTSPPWLSRALVSPRCSTCSSLGTTCGPSSSPPPPPHKAPREPLFVAAIQSQPSIFRRPPSAFKGSCCRLLVDQCTSLLVTSTPTRPRNAPLAPPPPPLPIGKAEVVAQHNTGPTRSSQPPPLPNCVARE